MAKTGKPRGTLRQKLGHAAIMAFFGAMWLVPYRLRNRWVGACLRGVLGRLLGYRKRVMDNLDLIYPDMPQDQKLKIADQVLDNAGRTFTENMFPAQFHAQNPEIKLHGAGLEAVLKAIRTAVRSCFIPGILGIMKPSVPRFSNMGSRLGAWFGAWPIPILMCNISVCSTSMAAVAQSLRPTDTAHWPC